MRRSADDVAAGAARLRERLADGPLRRREIEDLLGKPLADAVGLWLDLVRVPPSGTWERRRADLYAAAAEWLEAAEVTHEEGIELLVRRYLGGFGPAPAGDIAKGRVVRREPRARARAPHPAPPRDEQGRELLDLPAAPLPDPDTAAPVRFLPTWDATLLVHARRTGILPEEHRPKVFSTKTPHSVGTFLVDGAVAGTWRYDGGIVRTEPFEPLDAPTRRELAEEAGRLAAFHA